MAKQVFFPDTEQALVARAESAAGCTIAQIAGYLGKTVPKDLRCNKGWVGSLLEHFLGATAGSKAEQDFPHLGIELKTIPIDFQARPLETTFICAASLTGNKGISWEESYLRYKLKKVLWIPIEGTVTIPLAMRRTGRPILWTPTMQQEQRLRVDWEELMEMITLGEIGRLTAYYGEVLQIRPKAANKQAVTSAIGKQGERILALPRGFYLRKQFTQQLIMEYLGALMTQSQL